MNFSSKKKKRLVSIIGIIAGLIILVWINVNIYNGRNASEPSMEKERNLAFSSQTEIKSLNIFAHMDDDLGGMNPDIYYDIQHAGTSGIVISNWFTGNTSATDEIIDGAKAVYAYMAKMPNSWSDKTININHKDIRMRKLDGTNIYLINMMFPDGAPDGSNPVTMEKLWESEISTISPLDEDEIYTRDDVIQYVSGLIEYFSIKTVRHIYHLGEFNDGKEHSDHHAVGKFAHEGVMLNETELLTATAYRIDSQGEKGSVRLSEKEEDINSEILDFFAPYGEEYFSDWRNDSEIVQDMGRIWRHSYIKKTKK